MLEAVNQFKQNSVEICDELIVSKNIKRILLDSLLERQKIYCKQEKAAYWKQGIKMHHLKG